MGADANIVEHRQIGKQRDVLKGAADLDSEILCGGRVRMLCLHQDVALARLIEPAEAIEQRGLAGAVRADQAEDCPLCMSKDTPLNATMPPDTTLTSQTASRGYCPCATCACIIASAPPTNHALGCNDSANSFAESANWFAGHLDEGYLIPSTTRATLPPAFNFLFLHFLIAAHASERRFDVPYHRHESEVQYRCAACIP